MHIVTCPHGTLSHVRTAGSNRIASAFFIRTRDHVHTKGNEINKKTLTNFRTTMELQVFAETYTISANFYLIVQINVSGDRACVCKNLGFHDCAEVRQVFFVYCFISLCAREVTCSNEEGGGNAIRTSRVVMSQCAHLAFQTQKRAHILLFSHSALTLCLSLYSISLRR